MLLQDLGKFQKYRWLHASRMHCNVCLLVKLQLVKSLQPPIFANEFYQCKFTTLLTCHRPKLERMQIVLIMLKVIFWQVITISLQY